MTPFRELQESEKTEFNHFEKIIIDHIDLSNYYNDFADVMNTKTVLSKVNDIFIKEYVHHNNQHENKIDLFANWLKGLPSILTIPFYNTEIINNANNDDFNITNEVQENIFLTNYWDNCAKAFVELIELI